MEDGSDRLSLLKSDKVFMVLSRAGKPIFCCSDNQGIQNESHYADIMATAQALLSVSRCLGEGQQLKSCKSFGGSQRTLYFLEKPHLLLFVVTHQEEPLLMLKMQLALLHAQILSLLPMSGLTALFEKSPGYDLRKLLAGSENILSTLIHSYSSIPSTVLGAYPVMVMSPGAREDMRAALFEGVVRTRAKFGVLISDDVVVSNVGGTFSMKKYGMGLDHWDVVLLMNFLSSRKVSLNQGSETLTTMCMPFFDSHGNFFAYIRYIDTSTVLVLLSGNAIDDVSTYQDAFIGIKNAWENVQLSGGTSQLDDIIDGGFPREQSLQEMDAYHFVFKNSATRQYIWNKERIPHGLDMRSVIVAYGNMRAGMFALDGESAHRGPLQAFRLEESDGYIFIAFASVEAELFICMKATMQPEDAIEFAQHLRHVLVSQSSFFFPSGL